VTFEFVRILVVKQGRRCILYQDLVTYLPYSMTRRGGEIFILYKTQQHLWQNGYKYLTILWQTLAVTDELTEKYQLQIYQGLKCMFCQKKTKELEILKCD